MKRILLALALLGCGEVTTGTTGPLFPSCEPKRDGTVTACGVGGVCISYGIDATRNGYICTTVCNVDADCASGCCAPTADHPEVSVCNFPGFCSG